MKPSLLARVLQERTPAGDLVPPGEAGAIRLTHRSGAELAAVGRGDEVEVIHVPADRHEAIVAFTVPAGMAWRLAWWLLWRWWCRSLWCGVRHVLWLWHVKHAVRQDHYRATAPPARTP